MKNRWMREGADKPAPASGLPRFGFLIATHAGKFVLANLLFVAFSLPVVTMPAALCGLNRVLAKLVMDGNVFLWDEFIAEFKGSFRKGLALGLVFGGGLFAAWYLLGIGVANGDTIFGLLFSALGISALIPVAVFGGWSFVMAAMLPLGCGGILKNARALAGLEPLRSLAVCGVLAGSGMLALLLLPFSIFSAALIQAALTQYAVCFLTIGPIKRHIVEPWEAKRENPNE